MTYEAEDVRSYMDLCLFLARAQESLAVLDYAMGLGKANINRGSGENGISHLDVAETHFGFLRETLLAKRDCFEEIRATCETVPK